MHQIQHVLWLYSAGLGGRNAPSRRNLLERTDAGCRVHGIAKMHKSRSLSGYEGGTMAGFGIAVWSLGMGMTCMSGIPTSTCQSRNALQHQQLGHLTSKLSAPASKRRSFSFFILNHQVFCRSLLCKTVRDCPSLQSTPLPTAARFIV